MPGVSIIQPLCSGRGYISEKVVVWVPLLWALEMAPVRASGLPKMALSRVLFPTPELPLSRVILSVKIADTADKSELSSAEMAWVA